MKRFAVCLALLNSFLGDVICLLIKHYEIVKRQIGKGSEQPKFIGCSQGSLSDLNDLLR